MTEKEKLDQAAYECAWSLVWLVENGRVNDRAAIKYAADFLTAYADLYDSEKCRDRAQKLREGK